MLFACIIIFTGRPTSDKKPAVLIFSKTNGYHHACIPVGIEAIKKLGKENGFAVDTTTDSLKFTKKNLKKYAAIIFFARREKYLVRIRKKPLKIIFNREVDGSVFILQQIASTTGPGMVNWQVHILNHIRHNRKQN